MINFSEQDGAITFTIRVITRASRSEVVGEAEGSLRVKISSPPVDGAANEEATRLLAKTFGVGKSNVSIVSGATSRTKRVRIVGATPEQLHRLAGG